MRATLTTMGLYEYDPSIFDNLLVPQGVDGPTLINQILYETSDLELILPDPHYYKTYMEAWAKRRLPVWTKLWETTQYEYDPIANYDRKETWTELETRDLAASDTTTRDTTDTKTGTRKGTNSDQETRNLTESDTQESTSTGRTTNTQDTTSTNSKRAFDSATLTPIDETTTNTDDSSTSNGTIDQTGSTHNTGTVDVDHTINESTTDTVKGTGTIKVNGTDTGTVEHRYEGTTKGNIGVTTTQQMIQSEREIVQFDIYRYIVNDYISAFCMEVY